MIKKILFSAVLLCAAAPAAMAAGSAAKSYPVDMSPAQLEDTSAPAAAQAQTTAAPGAPVFAAPAASQAEAEANAAAAPEAMPAAEETAPVETAAPAPAVDLPAGGVMVTPGKSDHDLQMEAWKSWKAVNPTQSPSAPATEEEAAPAPAETSAQTPEETAPEQSAATQTPAPESAQTMQSENMPAAAVSETTIDERPAPVPATISPDDTVNTDVNVLEAVRGSEDSTPSAAAEAAPVETQSPAVPQAMQEDLPGIEETVQSAARDNAGARSTGSFNN
jgi:ribonuclease E